MSKDDGSRTARRTRNDVSSRKIVGSEGRRIRIDQYDFGSPSQITRLPHSCGSLSVSREDLKEVISILTVQWKIALPICER